MTDLRDVLAQELADRGWSHEDLLKKAGLAGKLSVPSLSRKLNRQQGLTGKEGLKLAEALDVVIQGTEAIRELIKLGATVVWRGKKRSTTRKAS